MTTTEKPSPIEAWLRQENMEITCIQVNEDETTEIPLVVTSLSMRGAQREVTGYLIDWGYKPVGRWEMTAERDDGETAECMRRFKL